MEWKTDSDKIFLRIDPGEPLVASLIQLSATLDLTSAAIISGVGMLAEVKLGFFEVELDDYKTTELKGIYDLDSIIGNITRRDGAPAAHVHVIFNDASHKTYSGHLIEARYHITMEIFLAATALRLYRVKQPDRPATQITWEKANEL